MSLLKHSLRAAPSSDNDREVALLARVGARDREAFRQLYHLYHRRLSRFLARLTHRPETVEEIINDTLWVVWQKAQEFRGSSLVSTWILGIAYRRALKTLRREQSADACMQPHDEWRGVAVDEGSREHADWLERALAQLPVEQRMVLELAYYLGYSCEEIAGIMDSPVNTVKTRMFHARQKMKTLLRSLDQ
jgi:RNA polymerase sigma-70 factor, ECF subfamily